MTLSLLASSQSSVGFGADLVLASLASSPVGLEDDLVFTLLVSSVMMTHLGPPKGRINKRIGHLD